MLNSDIIKQYKVAIGIECHVQLKTTTKLFASVDNDARDAEPNTLISHICFGLPGALPVLNEKAVELASKASFALNSTPAKFSTFDRKHYFYPDLPMGYQITQFYHPIVIGGEVTIQLDGKTKAIGITRAHLEADAGKSSHPAGSDYSLVDLNRAGTPLLEIVSDPDISSPAEARQYAHELFLLMKYAGVSDADLFHGNMRFDVNVSVSKTDELGTRTETKNLNSFRSVEKAAQYEINRQIELLEKGKSIDQETRGWDEAKQKTTSQRGKEHAHDYRYMPDPDIPPIELDDDYIAIIKASMPLLPGNWRESLKSIGLDATQTEILIENEVLSDEVNYLDIIKQNKADKCLTKLIANWMVNIEIPLRKETETELNNNTKQRNTIYLEIAKLYNDKKLSSSNAKLLLGELLGHNNLPDSIEKYANEQGLIQVSDSKEIEALVLQVLKDNPKAVEDIKAGENKVIGYLVGQVMKQSQGKANPGLTRQLIDKLISK
ncbi:Asp-tRNA(Asn)/Glu-tRNA(Gln) amidotransferase subunit GatB [Candidatus Saccharibacteria bacterium]|nr:Asp-tRNA(Asn)/Glu-tRNA(Gln) amidotransferase subunit GatB [Candidatus Saccharibacteria bacterium]